jgi:hypothetical protein
MESTENLDMIILPVPGMLNFRDLRSSHLIGFPNRFEFTRISGREFFSNLFKPGDGLRAVKTFPTMLAYLRLHPENARIRATFENFFDLFVYDLSTTDRAFLK